jgi:hypothetical protein
MDRRALLAAFHDACAQTGHWQMALATSNKLPNVACSVDRPHAVVLRQGSFVTACAAAARQGWAPALSVLAEAWSQAAQRRTKHGFVSPRSFDPRVAHVAFAACARQRQWVQALAFVQDELIHEHELWAAERADIVRDAVLEVACATPRRAIAWELGLVALSRVPVTHQSKAVSKQALQRFLRQTKRRDQVPVESPDVDSSTAVAELDRWARQGSCRSAAQLNQAVQLLARLSAADTVAADRLAATLRLAGNSGALRTTKLSAASANALADSARAAGSWQLALAPLTESYLFESISPAVVVAAANTLKSTPGAPRDALVRWYHRLDPDDSLRGNFRVAAPVASAAARRSWEEALTIIARGPGWDHPKALRAAVVALRVAGRWEHALTWFAGEELALDPETRSDIHDVLMQSRDVRRALELEGSQRQ